MSSQIRIGIVGYGNLGRGVEVALAHNPDMELAGVFSRRDPAGLRLVRPGARAYRLDEITNHKADIDVLVLCGGSLTDLPEQTPALAEHFNTVDSFDTHSKIPEFFGAVDAAAKRGGNTSIISIGWDPGLFSINRLYGEAILPQGATYTFWGNGLSQGHSDAIRRVPGVRAGVQYTIPVSAAVERVRSGEMPDLTTREKHTRECHVVLEPGAVAAEVERAIVTMPDYFADYDTTVHFITEDELLEKHSGMPHGGFVIRSGKSSAACSHTMEFSLKLDSNPEFTSSILLAYCRAAVRLNREGDTGAKTIFDIAPGLLSPKSPQELRQEML